MSSGARRRGVQADGYGRPRRPVGRKAPRRSALRPRSFCRRSHRRRLTRRRLHLVGSSLRDLRCDSRGKVAGSATAGGRRGRARPVLPSGPDDVGDSVLGAAERVGAELPEERLESQDLGGDREVTLPNGRGRGRALKGTDGVACSTRGSRGARRCRIPSATRRRPSLPGRPAPTREAATLARTASPTRVVLPERQGRHHACARRR